MDCRVTINKNRKENTGRVKEMKSIVLLYLRPFAKLIYDSIQDNYSDNMPELKESARHETTFITISKDEYDSMLSTIEILSDKELMDQLKESKKAKSRSFEELAKELGI